MVKVDIKNLVKVYVKHLDSNFKVLLNIYNEVNIVNYRNGI